VLTHTLRRLESSGLVARHAYAEARPGRFRAHELGRTLIDPIQDAGSMGQANGDAISCAQDRA